LLLSNVTQDTLDVKKTSLLSKILPIRSLDGQLPLEEAALQPLHALEESKFSQITSILATKKSKRPSRSISLTDTSSSISDFSLSILGITRSSKPKSTVSLPTDQAQDGIGLLPTVAEILVGLTKNSKSMSKLMLNPTLINLSLNLALLLTKVVAMNLGVSETFTFMVHNVPIEIVRLAPPMEAVGSASGLLTSILTAPANLIVPHLIGDLIPMVTFRDAALHGVMTSLNTTPKASTNVLTVIPKTPILRE